ncbi:MAG: hypothetical protein ABFS86_16505 [Planctomycetota bacterium]
MRRTWTVVSIDRGLFMDEGLTVERGTPGEVSDTPRKDRTKRFLSKILQCGAAGVSHFDAGGLQCVHSISIRVGEYMPNPKLTLSVVAFLLLPALAGCEDPREYDLSLDPYLTLEEVTWDHVRISWDAYEDAKELKLERRMVGDDWKVLSVLPPTVKEYTDDTVDPDWTYKYRLRAFYEERSHTVSVILSVDVPEEPAAPPLTVASAPAGLISPDGMRSARIENDRIWIMELVTGRAAPATRFELGPETDVAWMPDSRRILLVAGPEGASILYIYDPDTAESRVIAENATDPALTPDGRHVTFVVDGVTRTLSLSDRVEGS